MGLEEQRLFALLSSLLDGSSLLCCWDGYYRRRYGTCENAVLRAIDGDLSVPNRDSGF